MILHNVHIAGKSGLYHIQIKNGLINIITEDRKEIQREADDVCFELDGAFAFPGLINSHDHLDFNFFPQLGNKLYNNYTEWGYDIHEVDREVIEKIKKIPKSLCVRWGMYKNLLNGFTTVINHGPRLRIEDDFISVFQDCYPLHSPSFEKNWKRRLNHPLRFGKPYVMHVGEGTDAFASGEIDSVIKWNLFRKKIIAIHGVAMNVKQAGSFAGLIWCPASNHFLFGKTAAIDQIKKGTKVVFGTDSMLTAPWNAWEHFRQAIQSGMVTETELMAMLTTDAANLWGLGDCGSIETGKRGDIVIAQTSGDIFKLNPENILLVFHKGNVMMADSSLFSPVSNNSDKFSRVMINSRSKFIRGNLSELLRQIGDQFPEVTLPVQYQLN